MQIGIVASDRAFATALAGILDVFRTANVLASDLSEDLPTFETEIFGSRRSVETTGGARFTVDRPLSELPMVDQVIVIGSAAMNDSELLASLSVPRNRSVISTLADLPQTVAYAAACTGTFLLAEAGLLDDHRATTSWWLTAAFRSRYASTSLDMDAMVVSDRRATTAGAAFAHIDLALSLIAARSPTLADLVARFLIIDHRPAQTTYAAIAHMNVTDPLVNTFEQHVRAHLHTPLDIAEICRELHISRKTLERRTREALDLTPLGLIRRLRVEQARHLLALGHGSDEVATRVGYGDPSTLHTLLRRGR